VDNWQIVETVYTIRVVYLPHYPLEEKGQLMQDPENLCFDLRAAIPETLFIWPGKVMFIPTGVKFDFPPEYGIEIMPRSSMCKRGLCLANHVAQIDPSFRGEVMIPVVNRGISPVSIIKSERLVQAKIAIRRVAVFETITEAELSETKRGEGGFGHTGRV
jgi:dUTP pyrophosphatase